MENYYLLDVAGIHRICILPFKLIIKKETIEFITEINKNTYENLVANENIQVIPFYETEKIEDIPTEVVYIDNRQYCYGKHEDRIYFFSIDSKEPFAVLFIAKSKKMHCLFTEAGKLETRFSTIMLDIIGLENILIQENAFILHSCLVNWQNKGILFTAPSGTGKSTQGQLWNTYADAEIINGDRCGVINRNGKWLATGLPYAGSSNIYINKSVPIRLIVLLAQGPENKIEELTPTEIIKSMYPEVLIHHWDKAFVSNILNMLLKLINDVAFVRLTCRPDKEAVTCLMEVLNR